MFVRSRGKRTWSLLKQVDGEPFLQMPRQCLARKEPVMVSYQPIFEAIRQHCAAQGWYGADSLGPEGSNVRDDDPRRAGFEFPPATETQVQETKRRLGLQLPPMLRACYTELANGGFGLAYGLRGVIGGYEHMGNLLEYYQSLCEIREVLDLDVMAASKGGLRVFEIPFEQWVRTILPLIDEGRAMKLCLDVISGSIFRVEGTSTGYAFTYIAPTCEAVLGLWLSDELYRRKAAVRP